METGPQPEKASGPKRYRPILVASARWLGAAFLIYLGGTMNFVILFSDYPDSWTETAWVLYLLAWHALVPFLVGVLIPAAWLLALVTLAGTYLGLSGYSDPPAPLFVFVITAIVFAWLGSRVVAWLRRRTR